VSYCFALSLFISFTLINRDSASHIIDHSPRSLPPGSGSVGGCKLTLALTANAVQPLQVANSQRQTAQGGFVRRGEVKKLHWLRSYSLQAPRRLI